MPRTITAIDVGADAIKVVRLRRRGEQVELLAAGWLPLAELGRIDDGPQKRTLIASRVRELTRRERAASEDCVVGVSGRATMMRYVQVPPAPPWKLEMLMKYEAAEQTPGGETCAYDWRILNLAELRGQMIVAVALAQESALEDAFAIGREAGASEVEVDLSTVGLLSAFKYGQGAQEGETSMLVDIGADELKLVIQRGGELYFARSLPGGSRRFAQGISGALDVPQAEAERIFLEEATLEVSDASALDARSRKIWEACLAEANQLAGAVESSIMFCRTQTKLRSLKLARLIVTGGGSRLKGLAGVLSKRMGVPVEDLAAFRNVSLGSIAPDKLAELDRERERFSVALGLGLSRLNERAFTYDLVPERIKRRRQFLSRGIYLWYGAAAFLVALGIMVYASWRNWSAATARLEYEKTVLAEDGTERSAYDEVVDRHKRAEAEVSATRARAMSGRDLLRCLSQLKKVTPEDTVCLTGVTTKTPDKLKASSPDKDPDEDTFQRDRTVYLRGFARNKDSDSRNIDIVRGYQEELEAVPQLFEKVEIANLEFEPRRSADGGDYYVKDFVMKLVVRE